jgi:hypothetical protein
MQGTEKWDLKKINASGLMRSDKNNLIVPTTKNKLLFISTKTGKVENEIELLPETKENKVTELLVKKENVFAGFENGLVYELSKNKGPVEIFRATNLPDGKEGSRIVSLTTFDDNLLITAEKGNLRLIKLISAGE